MNESIASQTLSLKSIARRDTQRRAFLFDPI